jgi:hypothetical protein
MNADLGAADLEPGYLSIFSSKSEPEERIYFSYEMSLGAGA